MLPTSVEVPNPAVQGHSTDLGNPACPRPILSSTSNFADIKQGFLYLKPVVFFLILHTHQRITITVLPELLLQGWNLDTLNTLIVNSLNMEVEQELTSFCPGSSSLLPAY